MKEHQTAIAYGHGYKNEKYLDYDYIILHETAHEWWGNHVTACDMSDLWIHEGFATYAEMLYEERTAGKSSYNVSYRVNRLMSWNRRAIVGPRGVSYSNYKDGDIYYKGAVVLHMLRKVIDKDELFFRIIKKFSTEYGDHCVYTEHFMKLVNEETGINYDWFFQQYVFRAEAPELFFHLFLKANGKKALQFKWNEKNTNKNFALKINVQFDDETVQIAPTWELQEVELDFSANDIIFDRSSYVTFTKKGNL